MQVVFCKQCGFWHEAGTAHYKAVVAAGTNLERGQIDGQANAPKRLRDILAEFKQRKDTVGEYLAVKELAIALMEAQTEVVVLQRAAFVAGYRADFCDPFAEAARRYPDGGA